MQIIECDLVHEIYAEQQTENQAKCKVNTFSKEVMPNVIEF